MGKVLNMDNEQILEEIAMVRNHKESTKRNYRKAITHYTNFHQMTLQELIDEADDEEEAGIRWKKRKLKSRLLTFRQWLIENYKAKTVKMYFLAVKVVYKHYDIEIHNLPPLNKKNMNIPEPIYYSDILTREEIDIALKNTNTRFNAIILFMTSSGCGRSETLSLTVQDFIDATYDYHHKDDIYEALHKLNRMENVVPTFRLKRIKVNKYYFTFCSPEAVKAIITYLLNDRENLTGEDQLFRISKNYIVSRFNHLSHELDMGSAGELVRLRTHMFRKFHASTLKKAGMSEADIDALQGRGKSSTHASYFYEDSNDMREKYIQCLPELMINMNVNVMDIKSPEFIKLEAEKNQLQVKFDDLKGEIDTIKEALGNKL
jgi:integrase